MPKIMQNLVMLMEPSAFAHVVSVKSGNMCLNRFCIDEDASFELSGVNYLKKSSLNINHVIDAAFKKIIKSKTKNMDIHFVYACDYSRPFTKDYRLRSNILKGMKKYKFSKVMVTIIHLWRDRLITKEEMLYHCNGKKDTAGESVNEDIYSLFEDLCLGKVPDEYVDTYFLPQLTEEELDLVEQKNQNFMGTFNQMMNADVGKAVMAASKSDSKFVHGRGFRKTFTIENSSKQNVSCSCS